MALTRLEAANSKKEWERLLGLLESANTDLRQWVKEAATTSLLDLTNLLSGDLEDSDNLWNIAHQVKLVTNNETAYKRKLVALENLISKLESEILNTPTGLGADEGAITASDRQHEVRQKYNAFQIVKEVYNEWETKFKRACAIYKRHSHPDGTPITEPVEAAARVHDDFDDDRHPGFEPRRG